MQDTSAQCEEAVDGVPPALMLRRKCLLMCHGVHAVGHAILRDGKPTNCANPASIHTNFVRCASCEGHSPCCKCRVITRSRPGQSVPGYPVPPPPGSSARSFPRPSQQVMPPGQLPVD